jgi:hypothetical protein
MYLNILLLPHEHFFFKDSSGETVHDIQGDSGMKFMNFASSRYVVAKGTNFPHL